MIIFRNVVFTAAIAGLLAGLVMTAMQAYATVPLILEAETYEGAEASHEHAGAAESHRHEDVTAGGHVHGEDGAWAPEDGMERNLYTALANVVTGIGFALVLVALSEFAGGIQRWRDGVFWGFAGFAVFTLAPGLGLPPELPAMPAADLAARQAWWIFTVAATAAGLSLVVFRRSLGPTALGLALIVTPHIVGAPQPADHATPVPAELHHRFVVAVTLTNLVFWVLLGAVVGALRSRFLGRQESAQGGLA
jgi:cobalt transporter subunit CbtA